MPFDFFDVLERTTRVYTAVLENEDGNGIPASGLNTLTLTLYDFSTGTILNSRNKQPALNANGVTIDSAGNLKWTMQPEDNAIVDTDLIANAKEKHKALFEWTYAGGAKYGKHEVSIRVENLNKVSTDVGTVQGLVLDPLLPVAGALVTLLDSGGGYRSVLSNASGQYAFGGVPLGAVKVTACKVSEGVGEVSSTLSTAGQALDLDPNLS